LSGPDRAWGRSKPSWRTWQGRRNTVALAASSDDSDVAAALLEAGLTWKRPTFNRHTARQRDRLRLLARRRAPRRPRGTDRQTLARCRARQRDLIETLLASAPDPDQISQAFWRACSALNGAQPNVSSSPVPTSTGHRTTPMEPHSTPRAATPPAKTTSSNGCSRTCYLGEHRRLTTHRAAAMPDLGAAAHAHLPHLVLCRVGSLCQARATSGRPDKRRCEPRPRSRATMPAAALMIARSVTMDPVPMGFDHVLVGHRSLQATSRRRSHARRYHLGDRRCDPRVPLTRVVILPPTSKAPCSFATAMRSPGHRSGAVHTPIPRQARRSTVLNLKVRAVRPWRHPAAPRRDGSVRRDSTGFAALRSAPAELRQVAGVAFLAGTACFGRQNVDAERSPCVRKRSRERDPGRVAPEILPLMPRRCSTGTALH